MVAATDGFHEFLDGVLQPSKGTHASLANRVQIH